MVKEKVYHDLTLGDILIRKSRHSRRVSIKVSPRNGVCVTIPWYIPFTAGLAFLAQKKDWVKETVTRQSITANAQDPDGLSRPQTKEEYAALIKKMRADSKERIPARVKELADRFGFKISRLTLKHTTSNWGSCSSRGNVNLNINLSRVEDEVMDLVILHELAHLKFMNHGKEFHTLLDSMCQEVTGKDEKSLKRRLRQYHIF